jgi:hypothetical protein
MTRNTYRNFSIFALIACLLMPAAGLVGCTADQVAALQSRRQQFADSLAATTQATAQVEAEVAKLPANDPVRKVAEAKLVQLRQITDKLNAAIPALDAAIQATQTGNFNDPRISGALSTLPYGQYAALALTLASVVYGLVKRQQATKVADQLDEVQADLDDHAHALTQVVLGVEKALPIKTPEQKLAMAAAQDDSTKALVSIIKGA